MQEDINWKQLIDDFQDGFILLQDNFIFYKNEAASKIFGHDEQD